MNDVEIERIKAMEMSLSKMNSKDKIEINTKEIGEDYAKVLQEIFDIRKKRRVLYGDTYIEMPSIGHYYHAFNKMKRLKYNIESGNKIDANKKYESAKDNAIDIINYIIFYLIMIEKEKLK